MYLSHNKPDRELVDHIQDVIRKGSQLIRPDFVEYYLIIASCHDFGKYTTFFQRYLNGSAKKSEKSNHGFISAIFGAYVAMQRKEEDFSLPLFVFSCILHHHGNLSLVKNDLPHKLRIKSDFDFGLNLIKKIKVAEEQVDNLKENKEKIEKDINRIGLSTEFINFIEEQDPIKDTLLKLKRIQIKLNDEPNDGRNYFKHNQLYSALLYADKISASRIEYEDIIPLPYIKAEENRINIVKNKVSKMSEARNELYESVMRNLNKDYHKSNIFSITAPTGTGKTYMGIMSALFLRDKQNNKGKIIYCLPFTSIIEQNYESIKNLIGLNDSSKKSSKSILKHHYLSTKDYESEYNNYTKQESELLIESWISDIIVTTFVQVFETIIGTRNRMLKKFIIFRNSIILIDELQSLPPKFLPLIEFAIDKVTKELNCKVIIMTATKPYILPKATELLKDTENIFKSYNRTKIIIEFQPIRVDDFIIKFINRLENKSYLIVTNTINQSIEIFNKLKEASKEKLSLEIYYLSANLIPMHRMKIIKLVQEKLKKREKIILISTQVVEAGVDLDFDEVVRDFAPLDSIIQSGGRCNRNDSLEQGDVRLVNMVDSNEKPYCSYVYSKTLLNLTKSVLSEKQIIEEKDFYSLINTYYKMVMKNINPDESQKLIESINQMNFSGDLDSIDTFSLIDKKYETIETIVLYDENAERLYEEFVLSLTIKDLKQKREEYLRVYPSLREYMLNIPQGQVISFMTEYGFALIEKYATTDYYNKDTGFIKSNDNAIII